MACPRRLSQPHFAKSYFPVVYSVLSFSAVSQWADTRWWWELELSLSPAFIVGNCLPSGEVRRQAPSRTVFSTPSDTSYFSFLAGSLG